MCASTHFFVFGMAVAIKHNWKLWGLINHRTCSNSWDTWTSMLKMTDRKLFDLFLWILLCRQTEHNLLHDAGLWTAQCRHVYIYNTKKKSGWQRESKEAHVYQSDDETDFKTLIADVICVLAWFPLTQINIRWNQEQWVEEKPGCEVVHNRRCPSSSNLHEYIPNLCWEASWVNHEFGLKFRIRGKNILMTVKEKVDKMNTTKYQAVIS